MCGSQKVVSLDCTQHGILIPMAALSAMLGDLRNRAELLIEKATEASAPLVEKIEPYYALAQPYLTKAFQLRASFHSSSCSACARATRGKLTDRPPGLGAWERGGEERPRSFSLNQRASVRALGADTREHPSRGCERFDC